MDTLISKYGATEAHQLYKSTCPLVKATVGQHIRHSMDHMELAILLAKTYDRETAPHLHYDLRIRGGTVDHDMGEARKRILNVDEVLMDLTKSNHLWGPVQANFMLNGVDGVPFALTSTVGRELGFVAHHAIHHMAMIKLIATNHIGLEERDLPPDFGVAPSTVNYELSQ
jgi:hypothetical protein